MPATLQFFFLAFAGWVNRQQQDVIRIPAGGESHPVVYQNSIDEIPQCWREFTEWGL